MGGGSSQGQVRQGPRPVEGLGLARLLTTLSWARFAKETLYLFPRMSPLVIFSQKTCGQNSPLSPPRPLQLHYIHAVWAAWDLGEDGCF